MKNAERLKREQGFSVYRSGSKGHEKAELKPLPSKPKDAARAGAGAGAVRRPAAHRDAPGISEALPSGCWEESTVEIKGENGAVYLAHPPRAMDFTGQGFEDEMDVPDEVDATLRATLSASQAEFKELCCQTMRLMEVRGEVSAEPSADSADDESQHLPDDLARRIVELPDAWRGAVLNFLAEAESHHEGLGSSG